MSTNMISFEKYETGLSWMDNHHAELINMTLELICAMEQKVFDRKIKGMLEFLDRYVIKHFDIEDEYMEGFGFPEKSLHLAEHDNFKFTLNKMKKEFISTGPSIYLSGNVKRHLLDWLVNHIGGSDKVLAKFLIDKGLNIEVSENDSTSLCAHGLEMEAEKKYN